MQPIGFLDSGLGGISVLKEVHALLPQEDYYYYGDSLHHPYGEKSETELYNIVNDAVKHLLSKNCKLIVVACNTATTMVLPKIRLAYPQIAFVGTEPAIKVAHDYYPHKKVLVLATQGTIESERLHNLQATYPVDATFLACPRLAPLIEKGDQVEIQDYLTQELTPYRGKVEVVVLGCTHYVFVKDLIQKVLGPITFVDGNQGIAQRVKYLLEKEALLTSQKTGSVTIVNNLNTEMERRSLELFQN